MDELTLAKLLEGTRARAAPMSRPALFTPIPAPGTIDDVDGYARGSYVPRGVPRHPLIGEPEGYRDSKMVRGIEATKKLADKFDIGPAPSRLDPNDQSPIRGFKSLASLGEHLGRSIARIPPSIWRMYFGADEEITRQMQGGGINAISPKTVAAGVRSPLELSLAASRGLGLLRPVGRAVEGVKNQTKMPRLNSLHPEGATVY